MGGLRRESDFVDSLLLVFSIVYGHLGLVYEWSTLTLSDKKCTWHSLNRLKKIGKEKKITSAISKYKYPYDNRICKVSNKTD